MEVLSILVLIVIYLIINGIVAGKFNEIAEMKGHTDGSYFWFTLFLGMAGMLMVVALPDLNSKRANNSPTSYVAHQHAAPISAAAPVSTEKNPNKENAPISAEIKNSEKVCPKCGAVQRADRRVCWTCGQHFDN